jgi:hypothetical protein
MTFLVAFRHDRVDASWLIDRTHQWLQEGWRRRGNAAEEKI